MNPGQAVEKLQKCIAKVEKLRPLYDRFKQEGWHPEVSDVGDACRLEISITEVDHIREAVPMLAKLRQMGFKRQMEFHDGGRGMIYVYDHEDGQRVWLHVYFATGGSCRFVQTGVKTEPVFELQCNGDKVEQEVV